MPDTDSVVSQSVTEGGWGKEEGEKGEIPPPRQTTTDGLTSVKPVGARHRSGGCPLPLYISILAASKKNRKIKRNNEQQGGGWRYLLMLWPWWWGKMACAAVGAYLIMHSESSTALQKEVQYSTALTLLVTLAKPPPSSLPSCFPSPTFIITLGAPALLIHSPCIAELVRYHYIAYIAPLCVVHREIYDKDLICADTLPLFLCP